VNIGPVQLLVIGFAHPQVPPEIPAELERLGELDGVRLLDALVVRKQGDQQLHFARLSGMREAEACQPRNELWALLGLGRTNGNGVAPAAAGDEWELLADIPSGTAAALILLEHRWAAPLRDAMVRTGAFRMSDEFVNPSELRWMGLLSTREALTLRAIDPPPSWA
jgi:hypothetical protein